VLAKSKKFTFLSLYQKRRKKMKRALPSPAQVRHRHNFVVHGAIASMESRLQQLLRDKAIPVGDVLIHLANASVELTKALKLIKKGALRD
jgi:hypothetical protein